MSRDPRKRALSFGLFLIALGVVFLLEMWSPAFSAWRIIATYWPVLLIIVGLVKLWGYFTWREEVPPMTAASPKE